MSGPERPPEPTAPTTGLKRKRFCEEDQRELDKLDAIFKRIKTAVPRAPYILSTPSLHPYRYHSHQESRAWMMGHLFESPEEHLQYRTFLFREPYQDCFTLQHGEEDEPEFPRPKSQASNASSQAPKKKISLSDYRSKQANGVIAPGQKKPSPNLSATKPPTAPTNGVKPVEKQPLPTPKKEDSTSQKRTATESVEPAKPERRAREERPSAPPPPPPQKTEPTETKISLDKSAPSNSTPHGLPPLLSPVDQHIPYGLPALLSPTLPSNVQAELDRLAAKRKRAESDTSTSSTERKSELLAAPESRLSKQEVGATGSARGRSVSLNGKSPSDVSAKHSEEPEPSLVVKLRYTKKTRETIKRLLNLPSKREGTVDKRQREETQNDRPLQALPKQTGAAATPTKKPPPKVAARRHDSSTPRSSAPVGPVRVGEKRPRSNDDATQGPSKRPRAQTLQDGPLTPKEQMASSPALSNKSSAQKSQNTFSTPRKDHKVINMLRAHSAEGQDATPGRSGTTPAGAKYPEVKAPTSAPSNSKKQTDSNKLSQASQKLNQVGRSVKVEVTKMEQKGDLSKKDQKRTAVMGLECILAFMTAFHAADLSSDALRRQPEVEKTWITLLPFSSSYSRLTKDLQHLDGLRNYCMTVIAAHICTRIAPRAPNPKTRDSPHDISDPEAAKQHIANYQKLADNYLKLIRYSHEARVALPIDVIEDCYEKTWASRERDARLAKIHRSKFSGPYFLPIQEDTTPIQAVRFGLKFLSEYCEKERLDYTFHLDLDKVE